MNADTYATIRDMVKLLGRVGAAVVPLFVIAYMAVESLSDVDAPPPATNINAMLKPTLEDRTRAIFHSDLNEAWDHYESGDYSEDMWKSVYTHIAGKWNGQATGKGWSEFGWAPPKHHEPTPILLKQATVR